MLIKITKDALKNVTDIDKIDLSERSHQVECVGKYNNENVFITTQVKPYLPRENFGPAGTLYNTTRKRQVKNSKTKQWETIEEPIERYDMSSADADYITKAYVEWHLNQKQISVISNIPQPYIYRYIKHMKLKPIYKKVSQVKHFEDISILTIPNSQEIIDNTMKEWNHIPIPYTPAAIPGLDNTIKGSWLHQQYGLPILNPMSAVAITQDAYSRRKHEIDSSYNAEYIDNKCSLHNIELTIGTNGPDYCPICDENIRAYYAKFQENSIDKPIIDQAKELIDQTVKLIGEDSLIITEDSVFIKDNVPQLDPYPSRSEWKVRRQDLGLKNGENWRNTPIDENPGKVIQGDGSINRKAKEKKKEKQEIRRHKNIEKFNQCQHTRYSNTNNNLSTDKTEE